MFILPSIYLQGDIACDSLLQLQREGMNGDTSLAAKKEDLSRLLMCIETSNNALGKY